MADEPPRLAEPLVRDNAGGAQKGDGQAEYCEQGALRSSLGLIFIIIINICIYFVSVTRRMNRGSVDQGSPLSLEGLLIYSRFSFSCCEIFPLLI